MPWDITARDDVGIVTMNSNSANVQNDGFFADLHDAFDRLDREPRLRGVVLTAAGHIFSAGIDLKQTLPLFASGNLDAARDFFVRYRATNLRLFTYPRPTVAAVNGHAIAGGLITALVCDFRVAADGPFRFALNEVAIGIPMPAVYVQMLQYALGHAQAAELVLSGDSYDPTEGARRGLFNQVVSAEHLLDSAFARVTSLTTEALPAYAYSKRALQAPTLAAIEALANPQDDRSFAETLLDPKNLEAQADKHMGLTGRPVSDFR
ncbi:enoyl-CoA hydratase/isomerase family protein [Kribbella sp. NPDC004536]|uniref:enoyl-CoA hydratase/isomerase family protein n=1 Tax=Kribbella sp. NPDC004536 TaxID=3364106 RepID=UPI0036825AC7